MDSRLLLPLIFLLVTGGGGSRQRHAGFVDAAPLESPAAYWQVVLPGVPMPPSITDMLAPQTGFSLLSLISIYNRHSEDEKKRATLTHDPLSEEDGKKVTYNLNSEEDDKKVTYNLNSEEDDKKVTYNLNSEEGDKKVTYSLNSEEDDKKVTYNLNSEEDDKKVTYNLNSEEDDKKVTYNLNSEEDDKKVTYNLNSEEDDKKVTYNLNSEEDDKKVTYDLNSKEDDKNVTYNLNSEEDKKKATCSQNSEEDNKKATYNLDSEEDGKKATYNLNNEEDKKKAIYGLNSEEDDKKATYNPDREEDEKKVTFSYKKQGKGHEHVHHHSHDRQRSLADVFFLEDALRVGSMITPTIPRSAALPALLRRDVANAIPFSTDRLVDILEMFAPGSAAMADEIRWVLEKCESTAEALAAGETTKKAICATSIEDLVEFPMSVLGTRHVRAFSADMPVEVAAASSPRRGRYRVAAVRKISGGDGSSSAMVTCHDMTYPYAVFYCHAATGAATRAYSVTLLAATGGGAGAPARMEVVAVCHLDTSRYSPKHPFLQAMHAKPGDVGACHFLPKSSIIWTPAGAGEQGEGGKAAA